MSQDERFKQIKLILGQLDDLNQERRRLFTDWATKRLEPGPFGMQMKANAEATRELAARMETLIG